MATLDAFPHHAFDALGAEPVLLQDRIGGSVMAESSNFEIWSVSSFCDRFPYMGEFLRRAAPGQTALFTDDSGAYVLEDG